MTEPIKRSELLKLEYENLVTRNKVSINEMIQFGKQTHEQFLQYVDEKLAEEREAERKWHRQKIIEQIEASGMDMKLLDQLPYSLGGNKK